MQGIGAQKPGKLGPRIQCRNPTVVGYSRMSLFSLHPEPYVRSFLGKQEALLAKFSTGSNAGLVPTHPAWP